MAGGACASRWNSLYWDNHDQARAVSRFGSKDPAYRDLSAKLLATVLHLHRGTPFIYQGEELGMTNFPFSSIDEFTDIESLNYYRQVTGLGRDPDEVLASLSSRSRDNARTPMQWDAGPHAGFTSGTPWMSVNPNYREINAAAQVADPGSVFGHYRQLIALRHDLPAVAHGNFTMLLPDDEQIYAFTRWLDDVELLTLANFSDTPVTRDLLEGETWASADLLLTNYPAQTEDPAPAVTLRPWEARVYRRVTHRQRPAANRPHP